MIENKGFVLNAESSDTFERIVGNMGVLDAASPFFFFERIVIKNKSDSDIRQNNIEKTASEIALKVNILITQHGSRSYDKMHPIISTVDIKTLRNGATIKEACYTS